MRDAVSGRRSGLTVTEWLICAMAAIGFAFDIYELLMQPLIIRDVLLQLLDTTFMSDEYRWWLQILLYVPLFVGGLLGLLGGYVTDRLGRRRVLTWSILLYAASALAAGFSTSIEMYLVFRCLTLAGVCIEFVAAIAWLAELFPDPEQRERVLGYTQAFSSLGGLMVAGVWKVMSNSAVTNALPPIHGGHDAWRYTLISGVIPALPLIFIRPFLPESPQWEAKRKAGTLKRPSFRELFQPHLARTTIVTTILFACSYGAAFGAIQQMPQILPGLIDVAGLNPLQKREAIGGVVGAVQMIQEIGGLVGRFALAWLALRIVGRQTLLRAFQLPGLVLLPIVFAYFATTNLNLVKVGIFLVGFCTVAQFSFWGNYLPRVYPLHLRGTGESFAANFGGRILGTLAAPVTINLVTLMPGATKETQFAYAAAVVGTGVYLVGLIGSFFLPEPTEEL